MSVSSKSRKESTESFAAQAMHNTMGIPPALAQLNDKNLDNELPSRVAGMNNTDLSEAVTDPEVLIAEGESDQDVTGAAIEESKRASWGQPPINSEESNPDWATSTTDDTVPATRANEPERTLGNA